MSLDNLLEEFFEQEGWQYTRQGPALITRFESDQGEWHLMAQPKESQIILFVSIASLHSKRPRTTALLKFLNLINARMALGCFSLLEEKGNQGIQFVTSLDALNEHENLMHKPLLFTLMRRMAYYNLQIFGLYLPHIKAVSEGKPVDETFEKALEDLKKLAW